jgi:hypothetical protein
MKIVSATVLKLSFAACIFCLGFDSHGNAQNAPTDAGRKAVVVELFTSEGCSTCPPADALLQLLQDHQPIAGAEVIALEEHVDYWNHLGWSDPYSSAEWTQRQAAYSAFFKEQMYTPQMVVDGTKQFVGGSGSDARLAIENAIRRVATDVSIAPGSVDAKGTREFTVSVGQLAGNTAGDAAEVWLAVTEDGLESSVSRGENSGQVLHHAATLRSLRKIGAAESGKAPVSFAGQPRVKFDSHWNPEKLHVVVFVQEKKSRLIVGAASLKVTN